MPQTKANPDLPSKKTAWPFNFLVFFVIVPVSAALVLYRFDSFDPAPLPHHELVGPVATAPKRNDRLLRGSELVGAGSLLAPEDVAYDSKSGLIYTGCEDGWIKRVTVHESATESLVENWVNTGGRPLGLAHGINNQVIVADADKVRIIILLNSIIMLS